MSTSSWFHRRLQHQARRLPRDGHDRGPGPDLIGENGIANWSLENAIKRHVAAVLEYCGGQVHWAASELGMNNATLYRWRREWGWIPPGGEEAPDVLELASLTTTRREKHVKHVRLNRTDGTGECPESDQTPATGPSTGFPCG